MFAQLDANQDGTVDQDELNALTGSTDSSELLSELDSDGDGGLNLDELAALAPPSSGQAFGDLGALRPEDERANDDVLASLIESLSQSAAPSTQDAESGLVARLLAQYQSSASYSSRIGSQLDLSA